MIDHNKRSVIKSRDVETYLSFPEFTPSKLVPNIQLLWTLRPFVFAGFWLSIGWYFFFGKARIFFLARTIPWCVCFICSVSITSVYACMTARCILIDSSVSISFLRVCDECTVGINRSDSLGIFTLYLRPWCRSFGPVSTDGSLAVCARSPAVSPVPSPLSDTDVSA